MEKSDAICFLSSHRFWSLCLPHSVISRLDYFLIPSCFHRNWSAQCYPIQEPHRDRINGISIIYALGRWDSFEPHFSLFRGTFIKGTTDWQCIGASIWTHNRELWMQLPLKYDYLLTRSDHIQFETWTAFLSSFDGVDNRNAMQTPHSNTEKLTWCQRKHKEYQSYLFYECFVFFVSPSSLGNP